MTDATSSITSAIAAINAAMASLPGELTAAAPDGDFSSVLAGIQQSLGIGADGAPASSGAALTGGLTAMLSEANGTGADNATSPTGTQVVADAQQYLGVPYVWGGTSPQGFDCSGLVQYVYGQLGVSLPRTAAEQATCGADVPDLADAQPGDLVFFAGSDGTSSSPGHVGIYIGNGEMIDAPETGSTVQVQPVGDPVAIRRLLGTSPPSGATNPSIPPALQPLFQAATSKYGLPAGLLPAVASVESNFQNNETSSAGAEGIMQLMPSTAAGIGVDPDDPAQAIDGAAQLLSGYLAQYGSVPLALAAYNAGPGAVAAAGGVPDYPQTEAYVQDVMSEMASYQ